MLDYPSFVTVRKGTHQTTIRARLLLLAVALLWGCVPTAHALRSTTPIPSLYDQAGNLRYRTNSGLIQTFSCDGLNQLTNVSRNNSMTVSGATPAPAASVTVNGVSAQRYGDFTFAATNLSLVNGANTFTIIAQNAYGLRVTNTTICNLPSSVSLAWMPTVT